MRFRTPPWLKTFCRTALPPLCRAASGRRMMDTVRAVVATDRCTSFDSYRRTASALAERYEAAGAAPEIYSAPTGGQIGTGRWTIQHAQDVRRVVVDALAPRRFRVADAARNPWHAVRWSASTPADGVEGPLVAVDTADALDSIGLNALAGKIVLTTDSLHRRLQDWSRVGAAALLIETPVKDAPRAVRWTSFGWGGVRLDAVAMRLPAVAISTHAADRLRALLRAGGPPRVRVVVDAPLYAGSHDVAMGVVRGADDPQDEVWAIAHSLEPGAADNASGVATCVEIARLLESLHAAGALPRAKRSIRLLNGYECYGFFHYLEHKRRFQPPLAGACIDCVGIKPELCDRRLEWHATVPMSAGFVDALGEGIIRAALRLMKPGYQCKPMPFVSTSDTLIGDPKYGFPCPWLATYRSHKKPGYDAYHTSLDTPQILSPVGLAAGAAAMAAYLYFLADADSDDVVRLAQWETERARERLTARRGRIPAHEADFLRARHHECLRRLQRWMWGGEKKDVLAALDACERGLRDALRSRTERPARRRRVDRRVPPRRAPLSPTLENTPLAIGQRIKETKLPAWTLFWADGARTVSDVAALASAELDREVSLEQTAAFFDAHEELGYVRLAAPEEMVTKAQLVSDLRALGVEPGMDLMVHTSLSGIGPVAGGPETVVDALLEAIGRRGTLMMPTFNHMRAKVFNPLATPTINGAVNDAMWRRPEAVRSIHPSHPVACIGPKAEEFCAGHLEVGIWAQDSPIGKLVHGGGYILRLGLDQEVRTAYHVAENAMGARCVDPFGLPCRVVFPDGRVREVKGLAWRSAACPASPAELDALLDRRGLQTRGRVGKGPATLVKGIDLWRVRCEQLEGLCPRCRVRPKRG